MHFAEIDRIANGTYSLLHKRNVASKFVSSVFVVAAFIIGKDLYFVSGLLIFLLALFWLGSIPFRLVGHLSLYPMFFSGIFALMELRFSVVGGVMILLRALGAALTMVLLITTTPYTDLFSFLSLWMPKILVDVFMFTYRSLFILLDKTNNILKSMKLRGGYNAFAVIKNLRNSAKILGVMIIASIDMSERMYKIYMLRGYSKGGIRSENTLQSIDIGDLLMPLIGAVILVGGIMI